MSTQVRSALLHPASECLESTKRPYTLVIEPLPGDDTACTAVISFEASILREEDGVGEVIGDGVGRRGVVCLFVPAESCISLVRMSGELSCIRRDWSTECCFRVCDWIASRSWAAVFSFGVGAETAALTARLSLRS